MSSNVKLLTGAFLAAVAAGVLALPGRADSEALLLVDVASGKVLQAENATYPWYPASTSKLMTTYVTLQAVKQGRIGFDTLVTVSPQAASQAPSKMGFRVGTQLTVDNALKMMLVHSANDLAVVLAEGVDGSIDKFADEMNATSQRLGMTESSWVNPNGLPAEGQISSARDLAILARALMHDFPEYDFYWHIPAIKLGHRVMRNYNKLLAEYPGADGMKTGFICASGFNLVASATRNNRRLIAIVLGAPSSAVRSAKAAAMLEHGFNSGSMLNWLMPSLGTVNELQPINAAPPDLHEQICGPHRKRPAAEDEDEEAAVSGDTDPQRAFMLSDLKDSTHGSLLTGNPLAAVPPVVVYVGPHRAIAVATAADDAAIPSPAKPPHKRTKVATTEKTDKKTDKADKADKADKKHPAAKPADTKATAAKATSLKSGDAKAAGAKSAAKSKTAKTTQATTAKPKVAPAAQ